MKPIFVALLACTLCGCIGFTSHLGTDTRYPQLAQIENGTFTRIKNRTDTLNAWGEPESRSTNENGNETWVYERSLAWRGIAIWALIPIPIMLPVGQNETALIFSPEGELLDATEEQANEKGFLCSIFTLSCKLEDLGNL